MTDKAATCRCWKINVLAIWICVVCWLAFRTDTSTLWNMCSKTNRWGVFQHSSVCQFTPEMRAQTGVYLLCPSLSDTVCLSVMSVVVRYCVSVVSIVVRYCVSYPSLSDTVCLSLSDTVLCPSLSDTVCMLCPSLSDTVCRPILSVCLLCL
jgi:hypothetical protein